MEGLGEVVKVYVHFVARVSSMIVNWTLIEAFYQANTFQHQKPDMMRVNIPCLLNLLVVNLFSFLVLPIAYFMERCVKGITKRCGKTRCNIDNCRDQTRLKKTKQFLRKIFKSGRIVVVSPLLLFISTCSFLDEFALIRLFILSSGVIRIPFHIRQHLNDERSSALDITASIAVMMCIRWVMLTVGVFHQTFAGSATITIITVASSFASACIDMKGTRHENSSLKPRDQSSSVILNDTENGALTSDVKKPLKSVNGFELENGGSPNESKKRNLPRQPMNMCYILMHAVSTASLVWMSLWIAISPAQLSRWSEAKKPYQANCLLTWSLTFGCMLAACMANLYDSRQHIGCEWSQTNAVKSALIHSLVALVWTIGMFWQFYQQTWRALAGGCLLLVTLPVIWFVNTRPLTFLKFDCRNTRGTLLLVMFVVGSVEFVFHVIGVFTGIVLLTSILWGRLDAVFWAATVLALSPCLLHIFVCFKSMIFVQRSSVANETTQTRNASHDSTTVVGKQSKSSDRYRITIQIKDQRKIQTIALLLFVMCATIYGIHQKPVRQPSEIHSSTLRVLTWNVLQGMSLYQRPNVFTVARVVKQENADIVALQESYSVPVYIGLYDYIHFLTFRLGMHGQYGVNPIRFGGGDAAIISRWPIFHERCELLPSPNVRVFNYGLSKASVELFTRNHTKSHVVSLISVHTVYKNISANAGSLIKPQMEFIAEMLNNTPDPVILMGDFNLPMSDPEMDVIYDAGMRNAYSDHRNVTCISSTSTGGECDMIDHIFYRGLKLSKPALILNYTGLTSDHYPVTAEFDLSRKL